MDEEEIPEMASLTSMNPDTLEATTISLESKRIITAYTYGDYIRRQVLADAITTTERSADMTELEFDDFQLPVKIEKV